MIVEVRSRHGKLIGMFDDQTWLFSIKDGAKFIQINVPKSGLNLVFVSGEDSEEKISIPPLAGKTIIA